MQVESEKSLPNTREKLIGDFAEKYIMPPIRKFRLTLNSEVQTKLEKKAT